MGTRSLTVFQCECEEREELAVLYRQYDGYPTGHGAELKDFLSGFVVVNGIGGDEPKRQANGMSCLAAQTVAHFKDGVGGFYLYPAGRRDMGEEYIYTVIADEGRIRLKIEAGAVTYFGLPGTKQENMPVIFEGCVEDFDPQAVEQKWRDWPTDAPNDFLKESEALPDKEAA